VSDKKENEGYQLNTEGKERETAENNRYTHVANDLSTASLSFSASSTIAVRTHPGATVLTRPRGASLTISFLRESVRPYINASKININQREHERA
jgi:hypothetical protein